ncbi:MAG: SpoIVB peptidase [Bacilli bacterium]
MKKIFFLPLFTFLLASAKSINLIPGGQNIGIEIKTDGLIVSGTYDLRLENGSIYNPSKNSDINRGDIIIKANNKAVNSLNDLIAVFSNNELIEPKINLTIKRNQVYLNRTVDLILQNNQYKTGLYIKERLLGIGTVSFYDPINKVYGALGHEVIDNDTGRMIEVKSGMSYLTEVTGINKSTNGNPGSKLADFKTIKPLGDILTNTSIGIYGNYENIDTSLKPIEMAYHDEVKLGNAEIWTVVNGLKVQKFDIKITALQKQNYTDVKGITFKVTDGNLIDKTGGIVAGMSGSPIIQNNKLVGAVTHVITDNVDYGYGVYMEWMYNEAMKLI